MSIAQVATGTDPLGVPEEVLLQWIKLRTAYQRRCSPPSPEAALAVQAELGPRSTGNDTPPAPESQPDQEPDTERGEVLRSFSRPSGGGDRAAPSADTGRTDTAHGPVQKLRFDPASPKLVNRSKPVRDAWVFGPSMSVDQIVNKLRWCQGS